MLYINGRWTAAVNQHTHNVVNPFNEEVIKNVAYGNHQDALLAIEAAQVAFETWKQTTPYERATLLKATADHIRSNIEQYANTTVCESGKPLIEAKGEWLVSANLFEWYAEEGKRSYGRSIPAQKKDKRMTVIYQPMGVVGAITAWNFPVYNPARCWAAALAAGCTVIAKPSEFTPLSAIHLVESMHAAGIPAGVMNLLIGDSDEIGKAFLNNPYVKKISFTGSTRVGKLLIEGAAKTNTKLSLEMGGNAPVIIMDDIDIPTVAKGLITAKLRNAGQVCVSPQRIYIQRKIYAPFIEAMKTSLNEVILGHGLKADTTMGPLINEKQKHWVENLLQESLKEPNAKVHTLQCQLPSKGYFIPPSIVYNISPQNILCHQEIFGPLIPVVPFDTKQEAVQLANDTPYGLAAFIWTNHIQDAYYFSERIESGLLGINEWVVQAVEAPFGGWKQSGIGHECGTEGLLEYMEKKLISIGGIL